jgi:O-antigen/teichoic acid export membrane protein
MEAKRKILSNTICTIAGALVLNGVLQLLIYPGLNRNMGTEGYGSILYVMAFVNILGPSIGQSLNNSRLVLRRSLPVSNGDYNTVVLLFSALGIGATLLITGGSLPQAGAALLTGLLILLTNFRYYGDVEYRLSLNYQRFLVYDCCCAAGYGIGYLLFRAGGSWYLIFLAGETAALLYVGVTGTIFRDFFRRTEHFGTVVSRGGTLAVSYLITNLTLNMDRIFLKHALGNTAVSRYYVMSLIGKTLVLFVAPVNTILISYLTKGKIRMDKRRFLLASGAGLLVSAAFFFFCQIASPIFIRLFYPDLAKGMGGLLWIVNLTQILAMLSAYLFIIVLTFTGERWQLGLQGAHLVLLLVLVFALTPIGGLKGFSIGVLLANAARVLAVLLLGVVSSGKMKEV